MKFLIALILCSMGGPLSAQLIYETVWVDYDSAWEYQSMKIVPIRPKTPGGGHGLQTISLSQAVNQGLATISERGTASTENVHWLRINNHSDKTIMVASGQVLAGGRQDRMITRDTLMAPTGGRDQYIPVMCVEEGRWSEKEKKFAYGAYANPGLRKTLDRSKNQALVWKEIFAQLDSADLNSPTLAYMALRQTKSYQLKEAGYYQFFKEKFSRPDSSICGFVCISGAKVVGCDIFDGTGMFYDELDPLLYGYINDVLLHGSPPSMDTEAIKKYMDQILTNETKQEEYCRTNGKLFRAAGKVIHLTAY